MARSRRTAQAAASPDAANANSVSPEFDAEASLLALQKHVNAAAAVSHTNGVTGTAQSIAPASTASQPLSPGTLFAAAASRIAAQAGNSILDSASEAQIHPDLRSAQLALQQSHSYYAAPSTTPSMMSSVVPQPPSAIGGALQQSVSPLGGPSASGDGSITDGRKGPRRELSQSKRAAQNRAAQRAFRQRKEGYIKKLEQQVQEYAEMENQFKMIQSENYALREYIIHLQSKLLDAKADLPQPPANLNLTAPGAAGPSGVNTAASAAANLLANAAVAAAHQAPSAGQSRHQQQQQQQQVHQNPLERVAQAVAELDNSSGNPYGTSSSSLDAAQEQQAAAAAAVAAAVAGGDEIMRTTEEIDQQLQPKAESLRSKQESLGPAVASM